MRLVDADAFDERVRAAGGMAEEELTEDFKDGVQAVLYMLSNQPTIQPEPHWIPVTEEPIPDGEYLVTWTSEIQEKPILSIICRYSGVWDCWELQMLGHQNINVLAYMELPEPYKGVTT